MRTVIFAIAITVDTQRPVPSHVDLDGLNDWLEQHGDHDTTTLVSIFDREVPESNFEPQVFAAYEVPKGLSEEPDRGVYCGC